LEEELFKINIIKDENKPKRIKKEIEVTKEKEAIYLLGMLGYNFDDFENALELLEENKFEDIKNFYYELENYNRENETSSTISLSGMFSTFKFKNANMKQTEELIELLKKHNINL